MKHKSRIGWIAAGIVLALLLFHAVILTALGNYLVHAGPPQKADIALVLAGDFSGNRIRTAAELVGGGYAPKVLVSGPSGMYGVYESDLAVAFAVRHGYPESYFIRFENESLSTMDEARAALPEFRKLGAKSVLLVTSNFHTRRAARIFRAAAPDVTFYVVAAPDRHFSPDSWWKSREGRKIFVMEWMKTIAEWVGL